MVSATSDTLRMLQRLSSSVNQKILVTYAVSRWQKKPSRMVLCKQKQEISSEISVLLLRRQSHKVDFILFVSSLVMGLERRYMKNQISIISEDQEKGSDSRLACMWRLSLSSDFQHVIFLIPGSMLSAWRTVISVFKKNIVELLGKRGLRLLCNKKWPEGHFFKYL